MVTGIFSAFCFLMLHVFVVGSTSATFPDGYTEARNARTYDRFFGKEKLKLWVIWTDLDGKDFYFDYPVEKDGVPKWQDRDKVYNRTFPCGSSGVRFLHEGGKEVFAVHPDCSICMAFFAYLRPAMYQPHGLKVELRCYIEDREAPTAASSMDRSYITCDSYKHVPAWILYFIMPVLIMLTNYTLQCNTCIMVE
ncbi:uncharacterized protein LOC135501228 [Lineus longissimus]|uniref:uncharacterized protein LOC135501228 n=1 Tax=Lineus longissimus TaxID=88925 RepID=UPI002B4EE0F8